MNLFTRHKNTPAATFEQVLDKFQQPLYWHIRRMVVSHEDAQDILQDTFINIYKGLGSLKDEAALKGWVYRIATNECLRHLQRRRETALSTIGDGDVSTIGDNESLTRELMESAHVDYGKEMEVKFQQALLTLSDNQRLVFNLRYYDELPYQEISAITGSTIESLKVTYHNAKEKVTKYMINN